jgi:plastocyanin
LSRAATLCPLAAAALLAGGCGSSNSGTVGPASASPAPKPDVTVVMQGLRYAPKRVTIHQGQTVEWIDKDLVGHSVAAGSAIDSPDFAQGETWSHTFARAGVFRYHDRLNPSMTGTVVVRR